MDFRLVAAVISVVIGIIAPLPYIKNIFWGKTRPHIFSWLIWTITILAGFYGQIIGGGGLGAAALGITVLMNLIVLVAALFKSRDYINRFDVIVLVLTLLAMLPWLLVDDPITSIILLALIDFGGFLPTVRKAYDNPETESMSLYVMSVIKHGFSIYALSALNVLTLTFPLMLVVLNSSIAFILFIKKSKR